MAAERIGELCSLGSALVWAFAIVLFKLSGERVTPLALNLFKNFIALTLMVVTLVATGDGFDTVAHYPLRSKLILMLSGLLGIALADTVFFHSLNLIGVGLTAIVECLYSPFVILFSYLLLTEQLSAVHYIGGGMIVSAVLVCSKHAAPPHRSRRQMLVGFALGALAMAMMALGIVLAKPILDGQQFPIIWATTIRLLAGTVVLAVFAAASPQRAEYWSVFRPAPVWKTSVPAAILGTYVSMILWVAGFKYAKAGVAGILNQTCTVFAIVLATLLLKEAFTARKLLALFLALGGVMLVTFGRDAPPEASTATTTAPTHPILRVGWPAPARHSRAPARLSWAWRRYAWPWHPAHPRRRLRLRRTPFCGLGGMPKHGLAVRRHVFPGHGGAALDYVTQRIGCVGAPGGQALPPVIPTGGTGAA
ncbi:MAG: DMT family transporter [Planctomycetes bacterium]|nr:DMT family transporter [Planctomycetota bacterium]